ncbi:hypothetical protein GGR51DRAFT_109102 [Nemania sp. FL0031]|nr:hypothetical protein GGR51DRAFT_109102 [Nemania sp. FL0031]
MPEPGPKLDLKSEKAAILGIRRTFRNILRIQGEPLLDLPLEVPSPGKPTAIFETTDHYESSPLPALTVQKLYNTWQKNPRFATDIFEAPNCDTFYGQRIGNHVFTGWARSVTDACRELGIAKDNLWMDNKERIECAHYTEYDEFESQDLLRVGELGEFDPPSARWYAVGFSESTSGQRGCTLITHAEDRMEPEDLDPKHILRSELLALLVMLDCAGIHALKKRASAMSPSVFVLSFTETKVRALEARVKSPNQIAISIRTVLDQVPTGKPERDEKFWELLTWAMYTDAAVVPRPSSSMSNCSATTSNQDNTDDEKDGVMTGNTSFTENSEKGKELAQ